MFSSSSKNQPAENTQAQTQNYGVFIAKGAELSGNFSSNTSARIDGVFSGIIYSEEDIVVGESGQLKANVIAKNVTVAGKAAKSAALMMPMRSSPCLLKLLKPQNKKCKPNHASSGVVFI